MFINVPTSGIYAKNQVKLLKWTLCFCVFGTKNFDRRMYQSMVANMLIIVWLFIYCFFGQLITTKCAKVAEYAYGSAFYKYPLHLQMHTLFTLQRAQRPFYITGFTLAKCSLDSFTKVNYVQKGNESNRLTFSSFSVVEYGCLYLHGSEESRAWIIALRWLHWLTDYCKRFHIARLAD